MTALAARLAAQIRTSGPLTVADYMAACLSDPEHGYYMRAEPFGRGGDFITAPEVSQMFGELIGAWAVATWEAIGAPPAFRLVELGPGRGTLMADALRAARIRRAFGAAAAVHLVETSPRLRSLQQAALAAAGVAPVWHDHVAEVPGGPLILIANEFFDALPVHQFVLTANGWAERMIGLSADGGLAFGLRPLGALPPSAPPLADRERGASQHPTIVEVSPAATAIMATVAARIAQEGGAALVIDYGYEGPAVGDTLQAMRHHAYADPLAEPGEADLTAHVDFTALAEAAREAGAVPWPVLTQGEFLGRLGLAERAAALSRGKDSLTISAVNAAVQRLAGPEAMGTLFKVLGVSRPALALPAFDAIPPA